jgi:hypothetical protein
MKHRASPSLTDLIAPLVHGERLPVNGVLCRLEEQGHARETVRPALAEAWLARWQAEGSLTSDDDQRLSARNFLAGVRVLGPAGAVCLPVCRDLLQRGIEQQPRAANHLIESVNEAMVAAGSPPDVLAWVPTMVSRMEEVAPHLPTAIVILLVSDTTETIADRLHQDPALRTAVRGLAETMVAREGLSSAVAGNLLAHEGSDHPAAMTYVHAWATGHYPGSTGAVLGGLDQRMTDHAFGYRAGNRLLSWIERGGHRLDSAVLGCLTNLAITGCMPGNDWPLGAAAQERACRILAQVANRR